MKPLSIDRLVYNWYCVFTLKLFLNIKTMDAEKLSSKKEQSTCINKSCRSVI